MLQAHFHGLQIGTAHRYETPRFHEAMNRPCFRCKRPDASSNHKYCDACAHLIVAELEEHIDNMQKRLGTIDSGVKAKIAELEASGQRERRL